MSTELSIYSKKQTVTNLIIFGIIFLIILSISSVLYFKSKPSYSGSDYVEFVYGELGTDGGAYCQKYYGISDFSNNQNIEVRGVCITEYLNKVKEREILYRGISPLYKIIYLILGGTIFPLFFILFSITLFYKAKNQISKKQFIFATILFSIPLIVLLGIFLYSN